MEHEEYYEEDLNLEDFLENEDNEGEHEQMEEESEGGGEQMEEGLEETEIEENVNEQTEEELERKGNNNDSDGNEHNENSNEHSEFVDYDSGIEDPSKEMERGNGEVNEKGEKIIQEPDSQPSSKIYVPNQKNAFEQHSDIGGGLQKTGGQNNNKKAPSQFEKSSKYAINGFSVVIEGQKHRVYEENQDIEVLKSLISNGKFLTPIKGERKLLDIVGTPKIVNENEAIKLQYVNGEWKTP